MSTTQTSQRHRLIAVDGDGRDTAYRRARTYVALAAVYVAAADGRPADQFEDPSITLTVDPDGAWKVVARHAFTDGTVVAAGHADHVPAVVPADDPQLTPLAWVRDGEIYRGDIDGFADYASTCEAANVPYPTTVYAPTDTGTLAPVKVTSTSTGYGPDGWATNTVTAHLTGDVTASSSWSVDGRA